MTTIEAKVEHDAIWWVSVILTGLFAWLVFPIKHIQKWRQNARKSRVIRKAKRMSMKTNAYVYVVQWGRDFFYGKRHELRREVDRKYGKIVRNQYSHVLDVDFRNAIIAAFHDGQEIDKNNECK